MKRLSSVTATRCSTRTTKYVQPRSWYFCDRRLAFARCECVACTEGGLYPHVFAALKVSWMRVEGARILPRSTNECFSDKIISKPVACSLSTVHIDGWNGSYACTIISTLAMHVKRFASKCTRDHWCYDMLGLNRLSADGAWSFSPAWE